MSVANIRDYAFYLVEFHLLRHRPGSPPIATDYAAAVEALDGVQAIERLIAVVPDARNPTCTGYYDLPPQLTNDVCLIIGRTFMIV